MKKIIDLDKWMFIKINQDGANLLFDRLMPFLRQPTTWIPFYLFMALFVVMNFPKKAAAWLLGIGACVAATDLVSSRLIKPSIGRLRPCNEAELAEHIRLLANYCGQNGSFTSSHASNHFGMAMFLFLTLKPVWGRYCYLFFLWAAAICYAQVYSGVHYPLDVLGGAMLGCLAGWLAAKIFLSVSGPLTQEIK
jgi:undecaprenyl-diphosphatase